jgi:cyclopropane-fatty-acyl-phospholipid synthase
MHHNTDWAGATPVPVALPPRPSLLVRALSCRIARTAVGEISIVLPSGERIEHHGQATGPRAEIHVRSWRVLGRLVLGGDTGFAEAYISGEWTSSDLPSFLEWSARNSDILKRDFGGLRLVQLGRRLAHLTRANTRRGSRRNISAHYDLGNDFYALWLDKGMNYSSALYTHDSQSLEDAQNAKLARTAQLLDPEPGDRVLEIGCGWGAMAEQLVAAHDCEVVGLTLSIEQKAYAERRVRDAISAGRPSFRLQDYRDERESYDRIVAIEMLEAVGEAFWPRFFCGLRAHLKPGGIAVLQGITIAQDRFDSYRRGADFIQSYIFPGGMLPTVDIIRREVQATGLKLTTTERFGRSYALTLAEWRRRFLATWPRAQALGFDKRFKRTWDYYLSYCEAGFRAGLLDVGLYRIERPQ